MEENLEPNENGHFGKFDSSAMNRWLIVAVVALIVAAGLAVGDGYRQQIMASHMAAQASVANATINEMQGQLNTLTAKLNDVTAAQQAAAAAALRADLDMNSARHLASFTVGTKSWPAIEQRADQPP